MPRLFTLLFCLSAMVYGQESNSLAENLERKNNIDITLGGTGLFTSINYNRIVMVKSNYFINAAVGIGVFPLVSAITFPHQITYNLGSKNSFIELGVGGTYMNSQSTIEGVNKTFSSYHLSPIVGWRKHFKKPFLFRVYANPLTNILGKHDSTIAYLGISLGYRF